MAQGSKGDATWQPIHVALPGCSAPRAVQADRPSLHLTSALPPKQATLTTNLCAALQWPASLAQQCEQRGRPRPALALIPPGRPRFDDHLPTRPVDREKAENELTLNIKKATSVDETSPKQKHVRSESLGVNVSSQRLLTSIGTNPRMHCVHLGLPHVAVDLEWTSRAAHPER